MKRAEKGKRGLGVSPFNRAPSTSTSSRKRQQRERLTTKKTRTKKSPAGRRVGALIVQPKLYPFPLFFFYNLR